MNQLFTETIENDPSWSEVYPRPQMRRKYWQSLNGVWQADNGDSCRVPFCPESALSGTSTDYGEHYTLSTSFTLDPSLEDDLILLHFGAVDQIACVVLNGELLGTHENGYLPFTFEIDRKTLVGKTNVLSVEVTDTLDTNYPYGKQRKKRGGMWYTPVSGIWQSVWLEAVPSVYITRISVETEKDQVRISKYLSNGQVDTENKTILNPHLWSPSDPYLYRETISYDADEVEIYYAFRSVSIQDQKVYLNEEPVFLNGVLDQGYFPDGLFTPASPKEYERDILRMKDLGFNMLRKHIKLEPEIFYYFCDLHGMLVIQDMINNSDYSFLRDTGLPSLFPFAKHDDHSAHANERSRATFLSTMKKIMEQLHDHPSVIGYTLFNEGWGQFDSDHVYDLAKELDPTRLIDSTSGWFSQNKSDFSSQHLYFDFQRKRLPKILKTANSPVLISEFGGFSLKIAGHTYADKEYGYEKAKDAHSLTVRIIQEYQDLIIPNIKKGVCGCIYTQLSDIEDEINGFYTYDRKICKVDAEKIRDMNRDLLN